MWYRAARKPIYQRSHHQSARHRHPQAHRWALLVLGLAACAALPAQAGGLGHRYDGFQVRHGGFHYDQRRHHYRDRHFYSSRHHRKHRYRDRGYRHHYRHRSGGDRAAYLAGGLILGSVITHALTRPRYETRSYDRHSHSYHETRVIRESSRAQTQPSRRLFRDRDGNCYERISDAGGDELLISLPASECAW